MSALVKISIYDDDGRLVSETIGLAEQCLVVQFTVAFVLDNHLTIEGWDWRPIISRFEDERS